jgi:hypothetical protein
MSPFPAYDSGQTHLLLQLHGTIPITYRSQTYHIPIIIWFPLEYPRRPPLAYINPTKDMCIRKSKEVEPSGKLVGEMIEMWERKWEASTTNGSDGYDCSLMRSLFDGPIGTFTGRPVDVHAGSVLKPTSGIRSTSCASRYGHEPVDYQFTAIPT